jgi:hypothetical protein
VHSPHRNPSDVAFFVITVHCPTRAAKHSNLSLTPLIATSHGRFSSSPSTLTTLFDLSLSIARSVHSLSFTYNLNFIFIIHLNN